jgi:hypothetical protein
MKSITYKHQIHRFRVFRQSLRIPERCQKCRYAKISQHFKASQFCRYVEEISNYEKANSLLSNDEFQIRWAEPNDPAL